MKKCWDYKKLGEIATYVNGYPFKPSDWGKEGKPIIRIQNLTGTQENFNRCNRKDIPEKYNVANGDILISWSATLGVYEWNSENAFLNQHIFKVVFDKIEINKSYFKYAILNSIDEMSRHTNGATMRHIRKGDFDNIDILFPPLIEQQRIVGILDAEFEKIDALKANAENNLQNAKDLFQAALKKELEPKQGWAIKTIGDVCEVQGGSTPLRSEPLFWQGGTYPWFTVDDIREQGRYIIDTKQKITKLAWDKLRVFPANTVLLCCTASVGEYAITKIPITSNQQFNGLTIKKDVELLPEFLFHFASTLKETLLSLSGKATIDFVSGAKVKNIDISFPPSLMKQKEIVLLLDDLESKCQNLQDNYTQTIALCDDLKQALLRKAFSGEL